MSAAPVSTDMFAVYRCRMSLFRKNDCKVSIWTRISEVSLLGLLPVLIDSSMLLPIHVTHLTFSSKPEGEFEQEPRAAGHIRTECFPVQERHSQLRLAPCSNLILILSVTSSLEHSIILACGTLVVKHPGSNCLYLKGKLKCRLSGFQVDKVHWNRASANLQFGLFHFPVLPPPFKNGRFWVLTQKMELSP